MSLDKHTHSCTIIQIFFLIKKGKHIHKCLKDLNQENRGSLSFYNLSVMHAHNFKWPLFPQRE